MRNWEIESRMLATLQVIAQTSALEPLAAELARKALAEVEPALEARRKRARVRSKLKFAEMLAERS